MSRFEEGAKLILDTCGNKDNVIALSTISLQKSENGAALPAVRDVDAVYEDGVFYVSTYAKSNKIMQIENNNEVAFVVPFQGIYGHGIAKNLGWVLDPKNADVRAKMRKIFADWYDIANDEQDENCIILAIYLTKVNVQKDHGAVSYYLDFTTKTEIE